MKDLYIKININILKDKNLNATDKLIYSIIINFSNLKGYCWATNKDISLISNFSQKTIQTSINKLVRLNYLYKIRKKYGLATYRYLSPSPMLEVSDKINEKPQHENFDEYDWLSDV